MPNYGAGMLLGFWGMAIYFLMRDAWKHNLDWHEEHEARWCWNNWTWGTDDVVLGVRFDTGAIIERTRKFGPILITYIV